MTIWDSSSLTASLGAASICLRSQSKASMLVVATVFVPSLEIRLPTVS